MATFSHATTKVYVCMSKVGITLLLVSYYESLDIRVRWAMATFSHATTKVYVCMSKVGNAHLTLRLSSASGTYDTYFMPI